MTVLPNQGVLRKKRTKNRPRGVRILLAPNAFKGSLSAAQAARAMATGVRRSGGTATLLPLADGGDGTLDVLRKPLGLIIRRTKALDPLGRPIPVRWGYNPKTRWAVIEMAEASGLAVLKSVECRRRPMETTSFGTGQLIRAAIRAGAKVVFLGLGGSATVEGGLGILQALGSIIWVRKEKGIVPLERPATGRDLELVHSIDAAPAVHTLKGVRLRVLCDVKNPLLGARGAARAFGPQKGATPREVLWLERGLNRLAVLARSEGKEISTLPGTGAAGGAAAGLLGFTNARLERGTDTIFRLIGLEKHVKRADVVMTGEGRVDRTSWEGKALGSLLPLCRRHNKPLIAVAGGIGPGGRRPGVRVRSIGRPRMSQEDKIHNAATLIENAAALFPMERVSV
jgi:glycerate kinase